MLVRIGIAAQILGVCTKTLRRWETQGKLLPASRTTGGHRWYDTAVLTDHQESPRRPSQLDGMVLPTERVIGYVRVSAAKQKDDLARQRRQV